jgi:hypothetical protein
MTEIMSYDASAVMQGVKDHIKATFVELIPEDKWNEMIQTEVNRFFKNGGWQGDRPSEFENVVKACLHELLKEKVTGFLKEKYVSEVWENNQLKVGAEIERIITDNAGQILVSMVGHMVQQAINNMTYR